MVKITKIPLKYLQAFVDSDQYKSFNNIPISLARVSSYINNPNADKEDFVLFMAFIKNELVGYRTVFADVFIANGKKQKFAWLSGNWVHPKQRRKNISTLLFNEVTKVWDANLMYSNYAEASKLLYDKTNEFNTLTTLKGKRFYLKFCLEDLLPQKHSYLKKTAPFLRYLDKFANLFLKLKSTKNIHLSEINIQKITNWNKEIISFLQPFKSKELFQRNTSTFEWIQKFEWIKTDEKTKITSKKYHFSSYDKKYVSTFYCIKKQGKIIAIITISVRGNSLKIPYYYGTEDAHFVVAEFISQIGKEEQIQYLTSYYNSLNVYFKKKSHIYSKSFFQTFFIHKKLQNKHANFSCTDIQSGDGDSVFT